MAKRLFGLTANQAQRVGRVVDDFEHNLPPAGAQTSGTSKPSPSFWAQLTGGAPANAGRYSWKKQIFDGFAFIDPDPVEVETAFTAIEVNALNGLTDRYVRLTFNGYDGSDPPKPLYTFSATPSPVLFAVKVAQVGGANGTGTTAATYTYDLRDVRTNNVIGSAVALARPRANGAVTVGSTYGTAFYDGLTIKLWDAGEIPATGDLGSNTYEVKQMTSSSAAAWDLIRAGP
jgi:hypothetical protein